MSAAAQRWRGAVVPIALVALAETAAWATDLQSDNLARPSEIILAFAEAMVDGLVLKATAQTLAAALGGLAIGAMLGLLCGLMLGLFRTASRLMMVSVEVFRPIPSVALIPIGMLVFGFGYRFEISIVAFATFWPMLILTRAAIAGIDPRLIEMSRVVGLGPLARIWKIALPASLPRMFVALRLSAGIALIVAVTVEIAANPLGLGYAMMVAQQTLHPDLTFALLVWVGLVGWGFNALLLLAQRHLFGRAGLAEARY